MDILDIFLNKYSYKFPKGYPDMNNEQDVLLMESLLSELGVNEEDKQKEEKPDYDGEILNLLTTLSGEETKKKIISYLSKINKKEDKDDDKLEAYISEEFIKKNLSNEMIDLILLYANKTNQLQELADYVKDPIVNHSDLLNNDNLSSLFESIKLSDSINTPYIIRKEIESRDGSPENYSPPIKNKALNISKIND